jgi:hypothetical protein
MAAIYHGSLLTLAATRAESSSVGMFARIPPEEHELISGTGLNGVPYSIFVRMGTKKVPFLSKNILF